MTGQPKMLEMKTNILVYSGAKEENSTDFYLSIFCKFFCVFGGKSHSCDFLNLW